MALRLWCGVGHDHKLPSEFSVTAQGAAQANAIFAWRKSERERSHMATQLVADECASRLQRENRVQSSQVRALRTSPARKRQPPLQGGGTRGKQEPEVHNLLLAMAPLVKRMAFEVRQHLPAHVEMDDLVSAGTLGLVDALRKFDPARKVKIESYARHRIRGGILDGLRSLDPATRDMRRRARKVESTFHELEAKLGRSVKDEEIAEALGISLKAWHRWAREIHGLGFDGWQRRETAAAVHTRRAGDEGWMAVPQEDPFDLCYHREQRDLLNRALAHLPERERLIVTLYYQQDLTMKQIAARLEVDESRVSQLHAEALRRLKAHVQAFLHPLKQVASSVSSPAGLTA
jgi:RNA polymerase sigma factor for flagellar operon FliA